MADTSDKEIRIFLSDICENASGPYVTEWYDDSERLKTINKFDKNIGILHSEPTYLIDTKGIGVGEYETPYYIIWIAPKSIRGKTSSNTDNYDRLNKWVNAIGNALEESNNTTTRPWSAPVMIEGYGLGNEEDVIGLPGEKDFKNTLIMFVQVNIKHRRIFNC